MLRKMLVVLYVCALSVGAISCRKLERQEPITGGLPVEIVEFTDAIPLGYGELVAVTPHPESPHLFRLWFQKPDKTLTVVWVNFRSGRIMGGDLTIPRS